MYGFHAEKGSIELDSLYHCVGLDLGAGISLTENWDIRGGAFVGYPLSVSQFLNGESYEAMELSNYDQYRYYFNGTIGPVYQIKEDKFSLSVGPSLVLNSLVLSSTETTIDYLLSYTLGLAGLLHGEYNLNSLSLYADLKGSVGFLELLVQHDDFVYSYGTSLSVGAIWRLK